MLLSYQEMLAVPSTGGLPQRSVFLQHVAISRLLDELRSGDGRHDPDRLHCHDARGKAEAGARVEDTERSTCYNRYTTGLINEHNRT